MRQAGEWRQQVQHDIRNFHSGTSGVAQLESRLMSTQQRAADARAKANAFDASAQRSLLQNQLSSSMSRNVELTLRGALLLATQMSAQSDVFAHKLAVTTSLHQLNEASEAQTALSGELGMAQQAKDDAALWTKRKVGTSFHIPTPPSAPSPS